MDSNWQIRIEEGTGFRVSFGKKEGIGLIYYCKCMRIADFMR